MNADAPATVRGAPDVVVGGVGSSVRDVVANRVGEQERVLEDDSDLAAE